MDELLEALKPIETTVKVVEHGSQQPICCGHMDDKYTVPMTRGQLRDIYTAVLNAKAELARLRSLLADAYTVTPLEWVVKADWSGAATSKPTQGVVHRWENGNWSWWFQDASEDKRGDCESLADGMAKAEAWHTSRVTYWMKKVEVPT
jgi:hypothetical protein